MQLFALGLGLCRRRGYHARMAYPAKKPRQDALLRLFFQHLGPHWPALAGRLFYRLWFRVRRLDGERSAPVMAEAGCRQDWLSTGGRRVAVYRGGSEGPLVLLVHGWSGHAGQYRAWVEALLAAGFRVLAFDAPGHGVSSGRRTNLLQIEAIMLALQASEGEPYAVVAHSYGNVVSLHALNHGLQARRMIALSAPADARRLVERAAASLALPPAALAVFDRQVARRFGDDWWRRISPMENAARLRLPALLVHDRGDRIVPAAEAEQLQACWPAARLALTRGLGHTRLLRDAEVVARGVAFLREGLAEKA